MVTEVTPHIGYLHRSAEKIGENLTPRQFVPYTDRLDYLAAMNMNLGWALCVEKLLALQVSEKTRHLRLIVAEIGRISQPPGGRRLLWARSGQFHALYVDVPRAGKNPRPVRGASAAPG